jgi:hypothetical protein
MSLDVPVRSPVRRARATEHPLGWLSAILLLILMGAAWVRADVVVSGAVGQVYHTTARGAATPVADDIDFANGFVMCPDHRTLYVSEARMGRIRAYTT